MALRDMTTTVWQKSARGLRVTAQTHNHGARGRGRDLILRRLITVSF